MAARNYTVDIPGGTATTTVQMQQKGTLRQIAVNGVGAAAGSYEVSRNPLPQIGTAAPASDVIARFRIGVIGQWQQVVPVTQPVNAFDNIYVHCTGAANVGQAMLLVS